MLHPQRSGLAHAPAHARRTGAAGFALDRLPDGRLIVFFSADRSGEGHGLYAMHTDGNHVRKLANVMGDSLRW